MHFAFWPAAKCFETSLVVSVHPGLEVAPQKKSSFGSSSGSAPATSASRLGRSTDALIDFHEIFSVWTLAGESEIHAQSCAPDVPKQPKMSRRLPGCSEDGGAPPVAFRVRFCDRGRATPNCASIETGVISNVFSARLSKSVAVKIPSKRTSSNRPSGDTWLIFVTAVHHKIYEL